MKKIVIGTALVLLTGLTLSLGGCGWYGCGYHPHVRGHHYTNNY